MARHIYLNYLKPSATREINIDSDEKAEILRQLDDVPITLFNNAQALIFDLLNIDIFPKFIKDQKERKYLKAST